MRNVTWGVINNLNNSALQSFGLFAATRFTMEDTFHNYVHICGRRTDPFLSMISGGLGVQMWVYVSRPEWYNETFVSVQAPLY
jgi:hypothetical protein